LVTASERVSGTLCGSTSMKIALCQLNPTVGDFEGNRQRILEAAAEARRQGADWALFSELALSGYPPEDLLLRDGFLDAHDRALQELAGSLPPDLPCLVGCLERNPDARQRGGRALFNAAALCEDGLARVVARKALLPTYDIFDELRYFEPWPRPEENVVSICGRRIGITICEDAWNDPVFFGERQYPVDPVECVARSGAEVLVNLSASPWNRRAGDGEGKEVFRHRMLSAASARHGLPFLFVNQVGGNVGIQFDGGSMAIAADGRLAFQPRFFEEVVHVVDLDASFEIEPSWLPRVEMQRRAIVQGIADYGRKFGMSDCVLGLSGGIDSALTAALAVDALGADHVTGVAMPSTYSSSHSLSDAEDLARNLDIRFHVVPIAGLQQAFGDSLAGVFAGTEPGLAEENLQARARGTLLMAVSNKFGGMLLTTGNKSEAAVGYCTLYGDMNGALAPIADLWKTEVWDLARWINRDGIRIPVSSIEKPPSAELRPDQLDTDSLPPYEKLDPVLRLLVEEDLPVPEVASRTGMDEERVADLFRKVMATEFKRFQYAPTVRVSPRCWGGRRMPVSHRFVDERDLPPAPRA
jgi:NAD+ synthase (glutamine-hydrolysing)